MLHHRDFDTRLDAICADAAPSIAGFRAMDVPEMCEAARALEWRPENLELIRWVSAQRDLDLGSAITLFLNGDPGQFNHIPRDQVAPEYRGVAALLDAICQRINCGFYLPQANRPLADCRASVAWMKTQEIDQKSRRKGRWFLNAVMVAPMVSDIRFEPRRRRKFIPATGQSGGVLSGLLSPLVA